MLAGSELALARLISLVEIESPLGPRIMKSLSKYPGNALRVGITGPPGVGKSTLVDHLTSSAREKGAKVAILAIDPTSPFTGGAVLGDRIRMHKHYTAPGVFIRSMATRGTTGGLTSMINEVADLGMPR
jgi:LAO/AO transport system kinase